MKFPYPVILLGILFFYFYLFSSYLVSTGILRKSLHRRIWNYTLLITFLVSALSGLFVALQINYKWEFTWIDTFLKWHVDFGIALSFTGIFHFLWHWSYYLKPKKRKPDKAGTLTPGSSLPIPSFNLFHLGFVSLATQVIFIRAGLNLFEGNELVTGLIISTWMLFTGLGALAGRYSETVLKDERAGIKGLIITGTMPVLLLTLLYLVKIWYFPPGTSPGILNTVLVTVLILLPFCFVSGLFFTVYAFRLKEEKRDFAASSYLLESTGSLLAGLFTGFVTVLLFSHLQTTLILILFTIVAVLLLYSSTMLSKSVYSILAIAIFLLCFINPWQGLEKFLYQRQYLLTVKQTPYGEIAVTGTSGQINFFENNILLYSGHDIIDAEETIHYPLSQLEKPDTLLLVSGGFKGLLHEIMKYNPRHVDYTETDPGLLELAEKYAGPTGMPSDHGINYIPGTDALSFLKKSKKHYDAVILDTSAPFTLAGNRYYNLSFFRLVKQHMDPDGILSLSLPTGYNYSNESAHELNSVIFNTLHNVFKYVVIIQGQENYFLSSDQPVSADIPGLIEKRNISTTYVNPYYLNADDMKMRSEMLLAGIDKTAGVNTVEKPRAFFLALSYWAGMYGKGMEVVLFGVVALFGLFVLLYLRKPPVLNMYLTGFTSAGLEIILLFGLQSGLGNMYRYSALLLGIFMAGLALGAYLGNQAGRKPSRMRIVRAIILLILASLCSIFVPRLFAAGAGLFMVLVYLLTLLAALATGYIFALSSRLMINTGLPRASVLYSADVFGGATGALAVSIFLIPRIGFTWSSLLLAVLLMFSVIRILSEPTRKI